MAGWANTNKNARKDSYQAKRQAVSVGKFVDLIRVKDIATSFKTSFRWLFLAIFSLPTNSFDSFSILVAFSSESSRSIVTTITKSQ